MSAFLDDLRHALRGLRKQPGFFATAVLTLMLGIGAVTAIFTVFDAVVLKPLPFRESERIVRVMRHQAPVDYSPISAPMVAEWEKAGAGVFDAFGVYQPQTVNLTGEGAAERLSGYAVSPGFFDVFDRPLAQGRLFGQAEEIGNERVLVLSDQLWRNRFASAPDVIGRDILLNGESWRVLGIAEPGFAYPAGAQVWLPSFLPASTSGRGSNGWAPVARLAPGIGIEQALAAMTVVTDWQASTYPDNHEGLRPRIERLQDRIGSQLASPLHLLLGAAALVLLIACANLASLMLARGQARTQELALRRAIGAGRARLLRQVLAESLLIAVAGGVAALLLAQPAINALLALAPDLLPAYNAPGVDRRVVALTFAVAVSTLLLFGVLPAWRAAAADPADAMRGASRSQTGSQGQARARRWLVSAEVALAMTLLVGAGLLIDSLRRLGDVDGGLRDVERVLTAGISLPAPAMQPGEDFADWYARATTALAPRGQAVVERVATLPGVAAVSLTSTLPGNGDTGWNGGFDIAGRELPENRLAEFRFIGPDYLRTFGIPLLAGRAFEAGDGEAALFPDSILVNQRFVDLYLDGGDALGQSVSIFDGSAKTIIGVVGNVRQRGLDRHPDAEVYFPIRSVPVGDLSLAVKGDGDALALADSLRRAVAEVAPEAPLFAVRTLDEVTRETTALRRFNMSLMSVFAAVALVLAAVGLYGVIAWSVAQRRREIGVRQSLGATSGRIHRLVLGDGLRMVLPGLALGVPGAFVLGRLVAAQLYGVGAADPFVTAGAGLLLVLIALVACAIPSLRAARVSPMTALRDE